MNKEATRKRLTDLAIAATREWAKAEGYTTKKEKTADLSRKARKINKIVNSGAFGCNSEAVARVLSIMLDEEITFKDYGGDLARRSEYPPFVCVVPKGNDNSHDYEIGEVAMGMGGMDGVRVMLKVSGKTGNHLTDTRRIVRPAKEEKIRDFCRDLKITGDVKRMVRALS